MRGLQTTTGFKPLAKTARGIFMPAWTESKPRSLPVSSGGLTNFRSLAAAKDPFFIRNQLPIRYKFLTTAPPPVEYFSSFFQPEVVHPFLPYKKLFPPSLNILAAVPSKLCDALFVKGSLIVTEGTKMAMCRRCITNGVDRDGGQFGVCKSHARTKCQVCGCASLGAQLCAAHEHEAEVMRWKAKSQFRIEDSAIEIADNIELRKARLGEAKFLAHQALEVAFQSLLGAAVAVWTPPDQWEKLKEEHKTTLESA